jgi:hypothetical protein
MRVLAFVLLGAIFSRPLLMRRRWPFGVVESRLLILAMTGIATDVLVKAAAAPGYGLFLRSFLHLH